MGLKVVKRAGTRKGEGQEQGVEGRPNKLSGSDLECRTWNFLSHARHQQTLSSTSIHLLFLQATTCSHGTPGSTCSHSPAQVDSVTCAPLRLVELVLAPSLCIL